MPDSLNVRVLLPTDISNPETCPWASHVLIILYLSPAQKCNLEPERANDKMKSPVTAILL